MSDGRPDLLAGVELPPPPQQERSRRKHAALLQAGLELFGEQGYEATTIEEIARRAGVAVGAFYQHFTSKRQLLLVLMDSFIVEVATLPGQLAQYQHGNLRDTIAALVRVGLQTDRAYAGAYRAWRELALHDPALRELNRQIEAWSAEQLAALLELFSRMPGARPDIDIAMLAQVLSLLFWRLLEEPEPDAAQNARLVDCLAEMIYYRLFE